MWRDSKRRDAIVILCGLMTSTFLNMVVVPTMYLQDGRPSSLVQKGSV